MAALSESDSMGMRRGILVAVLFAALLAAGALAARERLSRCVYVPLVGEALLPAPDFGRLEPAPSGVMLPAGWSAPAVGVQVGGFTVSGSGSSFQLLGIANALGTPQVDVRPGATYCISAQALADSPASATRLRAVFHWADAAGRALGSDATAWQEARRWGGPGDGGGWSVLGGAFAAPEGAARLSVSFHPSSDDRVYLDQIVIRQGGAQTRGEGSQTAGGGLPSLDLGPSSSVTVSPWPDGRRAAVSFSFDWETAMGGLVHSRSVGEPLYDADPALRAMRMREGITTTLELFRPHGVRATYYANGYNLLLGNQERRTFMGDPTFGWATRANRWQTDDWATRPWFSPDPYGTVRSHPAWYFGDLLPALAAEGHDVQSHTFSHLYAGLASVSELRADLEAWDALAAERALAPARSLAFPWSGSAGMSDAAWRALADAGITSVTRTSDQAQYALVGPADPRCRPVPGHESILACPDFYLTERTAPDAVALIDRAVAAGGMIDLWAHTEEVVTPAQVAAWGEVVAHAAERRDAGDVWIAPLAEIAERQQAAARVTLSAVDSSLGAGPITLTVANRGSTLIDGLTLRLPFAVERAEVAGVALAVAGPDRSAVVLRLGAGQIVEVTIWSA
ncbi:MAG: hypothetical protein RLZZ387_1110 [Chloroflexota bacterium]